MTGNPQSRYVAFQGLERIAEGDLAEAAAVVRVAQDRPPRGALLVFDRTTGEVVDLDLRGAAEEVAARYASSPPDTTRRGRPKLGVVSREVTLLPRHWDWLARQPSGASVALRKLVEAANRSDRETSDARTRVEAAYQFMSAMAGDLEGFEDAARALFGEDRRRLEAAAAPWPKDVREEALGFLDRPTL